MNMKYSEATKQLEDAGFSIEQNYRGCNDYDISTIVPDRIVATVKMDIRGVIDTSFDGFLSLTDEDKDLILDVGYALAKTHPVDREDTKYVIKLNNMLYFAGYDDVRVLSVLDDNPGAILYAKVYTNYTEAKMVADTLCGSVEVPDL